MMYENLNFKNIRIYVQSENIVFSDNKTDLKKLGDIITKQIETELCQLVQKYYII